MQPNSPPERVDIAPVGFYVDRVVEPIKGHNSDRVYLIRSNDDRADLAAKFRSEIIRQLRRWDSHLDIRIVRTERWSLPLATETYTSLISRERAMGNSVWVNLSSGSKLEAVAGALACMSHGGVPYYVRMSSYETRPPRAPLATGVLGVDTVPVFALARPTDPQVGVLNLLAENPKGLSKKEILAGLLEANLIPTASQGGRPLTTQAGYARLQAVLERLIDPLGLVEIAGVRKAGRVKLTPSGSLAIRVFSPRPYHDEPPPLRG